MQNICFAQVNKHGYPKVFPQDIPADAYTLFFDITQDNRGCMYVMANNKLVRISGSHVEYDDSYMNFATIAYDSIRGRVYMGGAADFGFLQCDSKGREQYISLVNTLPDSVSIEDAYFDDHAYVRNDSVFFLGMGSAVVYDINANKSERWEVPPYSRCIALKDGIYTANEDRELCRVTSEGLIPQGAFFDEHLGRTLDAKPISPTKYIITTSSRIYTYDVVTNEISLVHIDPITQQFANKVGAPDKVCPIGNGLFALNNRGSNTFGNTIILDSTLNIHEVVSKLSGISSNIGLNLYNSSRDKNLWSIGYNVTSMGINSPIRMFTEKSGYTGDILDIHVTEHKTTFLFTTDGIFVKRDVDYPSFELLKGIDESATAVCSSDFIDPYTNIHYIIIGTTKGIYLVDKKLNVRKVNDYNLPLVVQFKTDKKHLYAYDGLVKRLNVLPNCVFEIDESFDQLDSDSFYSDNDSIIWTRSLSLKSSRLNILTGEMKSLDDLGQVVGIPYSLGDTNIVIVHNANGHNNLMTLIGGSKIEKCNMIEGIIDYNNQHSIKMLARYGKGYIANTTNGDIFFIVPSTDSPNGW
ncbi:MAG: hypothetical protein Q4C30_08850, partial [Bacteroidia bacterium]|nr:hypothetical protein [Bacteroidia bacterium]